MAGESTDQYADSREPILYVRLDGELLRQGIGQEIWWQSWVPRLWTGSGTDSFDASKLPYDADILKRLQERPSDQPSFLIVKNLGAAEQAIAAYLGCFSGLMSERQYSAPQPSPAFRFQVTPWLRAIRLHQFLKNGLVLVPLFASQTFSVEALLACGGAFLAFCLAAATIYLLNDILDLQADRLHPVKRLMPLASGAISIGSALPLAACLAAASLVVGALVTWQLALIIAAYLSGGLVYSIYVKRKMIADVVMLAGLYALRIFGGAVAISVTPSEWLLAFSMFLFLSLAFIKRYSDLVKRMEYGMLEPENRNYKFNDISLIGALAAACGMNAVTVLALYVASPQVQALYSRPWLLFLICPLLTYWVGRVLLMANRGLLEDDPFAFASHDRNSHLSAVVVLAIVLGAN